MDIPETEKELFSYLASITREVGTSDLKRYTTAEIARSLSISRNLASQYLNDLVRNGFIVRAGLRPVCYFSRREMERFLQTRITDASYASVDDLLALRPTEAKRGFDRAAGYNLSLAPCISQLKSAIDYPPHGLPVLMSGESGTGKGFLASLMFEHGRSIGRVGAKSSLVVIDCSRYQQHPEDFVSRLSGSEGVESWVDEADGGIIALRDVELLPPAAQDALVAEMAAYQDAAPQESVPRFVLMTTASSGSPQASAFSRAVPTLVRVPPLRDRTREEREALVLGFLKDEGRRMGRDILISRGAFRVLAGADFSDNVRGLKACIVRCCAEAFSHSSGDTLEIRTYALPGYVLDAADVAAADDDDRMIDTARSEDACGEDRSVLALSAFLETQKSLRASGASQDRMAESIEEGLREYEDFLMFDQSAASSKAQAYERIMFDVIEEANTAFGIDLSRKAARLLALDLSVQALRETRIAAWRATHGRELTELYSAACSGTVLEASSVDHLARSVERLLGMIPDALWRVLASSLVHDASANGTRSVAGIVLCHGYATATSIADAANRILKTRVYEAIDMRYDQQVSDIVPALRELLARYSFCKEVAILVDMGSLEEAYELAGNFTSITVGIANNASTGLALEVGAGLVAGESLSHVLPAASEACRNRYKIIEGRARMRCLAFCSESGIDAAERIRQLVSDSIGAPCPVALITCDAGRLRRNGSADSLFTQNDVLAIIGTEDPGIAHVPFIALEDLISGSRAKRIDAVFSSFLDQERLEDLHRNLVRNLTLRNVIESITILNPEKLLEEVGDAVRTLERNAGIRVDDRTMVGLCVHLCCLVERLVTRTAFETYADIEAFERDNAQFIGDFCRSFSGISKHYHVEVPMAEVAYVFDYIHGSTSK